jgi:prolyl-tRNA synthetase
VCAFLHTTPDRLVKTLLMRVDGKPVAALVRGDRELNPYKLMHALHGESVEMLDAETIQRLTGAPVGFAGPVGLPADLPLYADYELRGLQDFITGANEADAHLIHVCWGRDFPEPIWADLRVAQAGDPSPRHPEGILQEVRGIEVGHIFQLGTKYSQAMGALFTDAEGNQHPIIMGCYGLGVSRCLAAVVEAHHDEDGIRFPITVAPFEVILILVNPEDASQRAAAEQLYESLQAHGIEVLYDDRDERSGVKFKDADLIGIPIQVVVGRAVQHGSGGGAPARGQDSRQTAAGDRCRADCRARAGDEGGVSCPSNVRTLRAVCRRRATRVAVRAARAAPRAAALQHRAEPAPTRLALQP